MFTNRSFHLLIGVALLFITACAPQALAQEKPVTLRLGIPDGDNVHYAPYVLEFIEQVKLLSNEHITIEPVWHAGDSTDAKYEKGVIQLVRDGKADLGLAASRAWDSKVFANLQVLQTPFLITDDALAEAVATSDIAAELLDSLSSGGVVGLTFWPEDLRHPFSVDPAKPILSPEDFVGLEVRTTDTGVSDMLIKAMGGTPLFEANDYQAAESGLLQGATLTGRPVATGNVTFFPKYQFLFANGAAFERLSEEQRNILRQAAAATQRKAIDERPGEENAASSWCADGGTIVMASEEQVAAFETAAQPVYNTIAQDPSNAELIAAIRELKAKTASSPGAQACASTVTIPIQASAENQTWSEGLPPNGTWTVELSDDDFVRMGVLKSTASDWSGQQIYELQNGEGVFRRLVNNVEVETCPFTYKVVENFVRLSFHDKGLGHYDCGNDIDDFQWRLDADGLHFHLVQTTEFKAEVTALYEAKPWQKVANP